MAIFCAIVLKGIKPPYKVGEVIVFNKPDNSTNAGVETDLKMWNRVSDSEEVVAKVKGLGEIDIQPAEVDKDIDTYPKRLEKLLDTRINELGIKIDIEE